MFIRTAAFKSRKLAGPKQPATRLNSNEMEKSALGAFFPGHIIWEIIGMFSKKVPASGLKYTKKQWQISDLVLDYIQLVVY